MQDSAPTGLPGLLAALPARITAADRLQEVDMAATARLLARLTDDAEARAAFFGRAEAARDVTDGLRLTFPDAAIVHLRPSGNAPELRCYVEAGDAGTARALLRDTLEKLTTALDDT